MKPYNRVANSAARFGEDSVFRLLLLNAVYSLTDALFVSWGVGESAMGGISVVLPFVFLQGAISTALGGGAASLVSRRLGAGAENEAGEFTINAMAAFYLTAVFVTALGFAFRGRVLALLGATGELYPYAETYFTILLAGNVFSTGFSAIIRAEGNACYALLIWLIPVSLNIVLDAVFILRLKLGVAGSAYATVIGQAVSFCMSVYYFTRRSAQKFKGARFRVRRVGEVLAIGLPSLVQMGSLSVSIALINRVLGVVGGVSGVTAFAYMSRILTFAAVPFTAVTQALSPIAGYQYGAKRPDRLRDAVRYSVFLAAGYGLLAAALLIGFPAFFIGIFTDGAQTLQTGAQGLRILSAALIGMPLPLIAGAVFQATGAKANALLLYSASLLFLLSAAPLLSSIYGVSGVWWAYAAANAAASVLALLILLAAAKRLKKNGLALN